MPGVNKKVTRTSTNLQLSAFLLLPPGIKGLKENIGIYINNLYNGNENLPNIR